MSPLPRPESAAPLIALQGLGKRFPGPGGDVQALRGLEACLPAGGITGLVGPDGAGKSTLLRLLAGLLLPDQGRLEALGLDCVDDADALRPLIGYMPQRFGLYEDLTVQENLTLYARLRGLPPSRWPETFDRLLAFTGLARFTGRLAGKLSGGMKQKLGLACALIREPRLLLLDEPSVGVDPISRRELWRMVRELVAQGIGVIWSTAYLDEAELCDQVLLLHEGELLYHGPPAQLTAHVQGRAFQLYPGDEDRRPLARRALADARLVDAVIQGEAVRVVLREGQSPDLLQALAPGAEARPVPARFEDAFIDRLHDRRNIRLSPSIAAPLGMKGDVPVRAEALCRDFGDFRAVDNVSFTLSRGEVFGLIGPNGAGKSTVFKMLCGLLPPSSGRAEVAGINLAHSPARARARLGYMAQKFSLYADLGVYENLRFFAGAYGLQGEARRNAIDGVLDSLELERYCDMTAADLPLGFKQRLALACAILHQPEILFLDEPTSGVDPLTRRDFWSRINDHVATGVTVLVTTHFLEEAEYCDRIAMIYRGRMIALGRPDDIKARCPGDNPSLEDAFVHLVSAYDREHGDG